MLPETRGCGEGQGQYHLIGWQWFERAGSLVFSPDSWLLEGMFCDFFYLCGLNGVTESSRWTAGPCSCPLCLEVACWFPLSSVTCSPEFEKPDIAHTNREGLAGEATEQWPGCQACLCSLSPQGWGEEKRAWKCLCKGLSLFTLPSFLIVINSRLNC